MQYLFYIGLEVFIITNGYLLNKIFVGANRFKPMILSEKSALSPVNNMIKNLMLILNGFK